MKNYLLIALIFTCSFACKSATNVPKGLENQVIVDLPCGETQTEPLITTFSDESPLTVITLWEGLLKNSSSTPMILFSNQYCPACSRCLSGKTAHQVTGKPAGRRNLKLKDFQTTKEKLIKKFGEESFEVKIFETVKKINPQTKDEKTNLLKMLSTIHSRTWWHSNQTVDQAAALMVLGAK